MTRDPATNKQPQRPPENECCDLYGEYCYPCNPTVEPKVSRGVGRKKSVSDGKRHS